MRVIQLDPVVQQRVESKNAAAIARAKMPQIPSRQSTIGMSPRPAGVHFGQSSAAWGWFHPMSVQYSLGKYCVPPFTSSSPLARNAAIFSGLTLISIIPV